MGRTNAGAGRIAWVLPSAVLAAVVLAAWLPGVDAAAARAVGDPPVGAVAPGPVAAPPDAAAIEAASSDPIITTIAGIPPDGPADTTQFVGPLSVVAAADGSVVVADEGGVRVYRVADGRAVVMAGTGESADFGDGGGAVNAALGRPAAIAEGAGGAIYVADAGNHRVRAVGSDGIIRRVAGAATATAGFGGDGGPAVSALLSSPAGVAVGASGDVYVGDTGNHRVRRITPAGIISTVAGTGTAAFTGDGTAALQALSSPDKVVATAAGVYVADRGNLRLRLIDPAGTLTTVAGGGATPAADAVPAALVALSSDFTFGVAPSGAVYLTTGGLVYRIDALGVLRLVSVGSVLGLPLPPPQGPLDGWAYRDVAVTTGGTLLAAMAVHTQNFFFDPNPGLSRVVVALPPAAQARVVAGVPDVPTVARLWYPTHMAVSPAGDVWVRHNPPIYGPVRRYPRVVTVAGSATYGGNAASGAPIGTGLGGSLLNVVTDFGISKTTILRQTASTSTELFQGFATGGGCTDGVFYPGELTESSTLGLVIEQEIGRHCLMRWTGGGPGSPTFAPVVDTARFGSVDGLAALPDGSLVLSDATKDQIWRVDAAGAVTLVAGTGDYGSSGDGGPATQARLAHPRGLAVDTDGTIYFAESFSARVRSISPAGVIQTVAGNGAYAYAGDGGPANRASFNKPVAVGVDAAHNLYVLDAVAGTVRRIGPPPTLPAGASRFVPTPPQRVLDTRLGIGAPAGRPGPGGSVSLALAGAAAGIPADATAAVLNVTITEAAGPGYVQVLPTGRAAIGSSSNLNVDEAGQTIANLVTVKIGDGGTVTLHTSGGGHLVADVLGYYVPVAAPTRDGRYQALTPTRVLDTRTGLGQPSARRPAAREQVSLLVAGQGGVPAAGASSVVLDLVATDTAGPGYVQAFPTAGSTAPGASSNLNVTRAGQTIANLVIVPIGADGTVTLYTHDAAHLVADVLGYVTDASAVPSTVGVFVALDPARLVDTRASGPKPAGGGALRIAPPGRGGVPSDGVSAVFANITATEPDAPGYVQAGPAGRFTYGSSSNLNVERAGQTIPNAAIVTLGDGGAADLYTLTGTHLVLDVSGWFVGD